MRLRWVVALLGMGVTLLVSGCDSAPSDPYSEMKMLSPQEAGVAQQDEDPVLDAERSHNAKFIHKDKKPRGR